MKKIPLIIFLLAWTSFAFGAAPGIHRALFDEAANILEIHFNDLILSDSSRFNIGGLSFNDGSGGTVALNGGRILNTASQDSIIRISLTFTGNIGFYQQEIEGTIYDYYTWGTDYRRLKELESLEDKVNIRMSVRRMTYLGVNNDANEEIAGDDAILVDYNHDADPPQLTYAEYDAGMNRVRLVFDRPVQWDNIDEDRMHYWIDSLGIEHRDPGNGILDAGEDRNGNGALDLEPNLNILSISISDTFGSVTLSAGEVVDTVDNDTIEITLVRTNYRPIEELAPDLLKISFPNFTFVDPNFNPVTPVTGFDLDFIEDTIPLSVDSAAYDKSKNELTVYFEGRSLGREFAVMPKFKVAKDDTLPLQGASKPPVISSNFIRITLLSVDQMVVEAMMNNSSTDTIKVMVESYAILDEYGNGNVASGAEITIIQESGSNKPPAVDSVYYNATANKLTVYFDVRLLLTPGNVNVQGFSLLNGEDTLTFTTEEFGGAASRLEIMLNPTDELGVESLQDKNNFLLLLQPFSVYQSPRNNGNWAVTRADSVNVTYVSDASSPLPDYVKYNRSTKQLVFHFTDAMSKSADFSKITFAGHSITGAAVEYGDTAEYGCDAPAWLMLGLTDNDVGNIEGPATVRDMVVVTLDTGAFTNADGLDSPQLPDFMDGDYLYEEGAVTDTVKVLAGIGRDFWLSSKEAFPTLDRSIPATIRKVGTHCVIWVADDQWTPYDSVEISGSIYYTNHNTAPLIPAEVDVVFNHFENTVYDSVNGYFANGKQHLLPSIVNILLCDIRDEYSLGRNDTKDTYWIGSFFNSNDQYTAFQAGDEFNTNDMNLIYIDSWPQLYTQADSSWYWYETTSTREWRLNLPPGRTNSSYNVTNIPITIYNAVDNAYTKLVCYKVDKWESKWMVEGFASLSELLIEGEASFYGAKNPTTPTANSLKNFSTGLKTRIDFFNSYLFVLYLYEKFGGLEFIKELAVQPSVDMNAVNITFQRLLARGAGDVVLRERWRNFTAKDVFSYYAVACLLDTTNMQFSLTDTTIAPDDTMFNFTNVNVQGVISSKNATAMKWDIDKDPPPYNLSQEEWSFEYYYSTFNPLAGMTNPMIAATQLTGDTVSMADTSRINILLPFSRINLCRILLKNEAVSTANNPHFYWEYFPYDTLTKKVSFQVSPDTLWTLAHYKQQGDSLVAAGEYKSMVIVSSLGGFGKITLQADSLDIYMLSVAQSPIVASRFDVYLVVSNLIWGSGRQGSDVPEIRYRLVSDTVFISVPMAPAYMMAGPEDTLGLSFYITHLDFDTQGEYEIKAYFSDISGREYLISGIESFTVDSYNPGSSLIMRSSGASFRFEPNSYPRPLLLSLTTVPGNAAAGDEHTYLYNKTFFRAPPVVDRVPIGPAYRLQPGIELEEPAWVSLPYAEYIGEHSPGELGVYLYHESDWVYLGGTPDPADQTIKARAKKTGLIQIQAGPHGEVFFPIPENYSLKQNYPNPFNPVTRIDYQLPRAGETVLKVFDVTGREVAKLQDGFQNTGYYSALWDGCSSAGTPVASGIYFYQLKSGSFSRTCKMILIK